MALAVPRHRALACRHARRSHDKLAAPPAGTRRSSFMFQVGGEDDDTPCDERSMVDSYLNMLRDSKVVEELRARKHFERPRDAGKRRRRERIAQSKWERQNRDWWSPVTYHEASGLREEEEGVPTPFSGFFTMRETSGGLTAGELGDEEEGLFEATEDLGSYIGVPGEGYYLHDANAWAAGGGGGGGYLGAAPAVPAHHQRHLDQQQQQQQQQGGYMQFGDWQGGYISGDGAEPAVDGLQGGGYAAPLAADPAQAAWMALGDVVDVGGGAVAAPPEAPPDAADASAYSAGGVYGAAAVEAEPRSGGGSSGSSWGGGGSAGDGVHEGLGAAAFPDTERVPWAGKARKGQPVGGSGAAALPPALPPPVVGPADDPVAASATADGGVAGEGGAVGASGTRRGARGDAASGAAGEEEGAEARGRQGQARRQGGTARRAGGQKARNGGGGSKWVVRRTGAAAGGAGASQQQGPIVLDDPPASPGQGAGEASAGSRAPQKVR